jgi:coenzyme F420-0:L-glutamate ligase/coenzyme F420-1:gamma-L-glutamate ligase
LYIGNLMEIHAIKTPIIKPNDDLVQIAMDSLNSAGFTLNEKDILVFAETVVGTAQNRVLDYSEIKSASDEALKLGKKYKLDPKFVQIILEEADVVLGGVEGVLLTEKDGVLIANAGIDQSNSGGLSKYVFFPRDPQGTAAEIRQKLMQIKKIKNLGIIIADSRVQPMKRGVIGVAIGVSGFEPIIDIRGKKDLFGRVLKFKTISIVDDLSSAAETVIGEADEQTPIALIRNAPVTFTNRKIDVKEMIMPRNECLFMNVFKDLIAYKKPEYSRNIPK